MKMRLFFNLILMQLVLIATTAPKVWASAFYTQVGGGVTQFRGASTFFQGGVPSVSDLGFGLEAGVFFKPSSGDPLVEVQFGVLHKFSSSSTVSGLNSLAYYLQIPYPMIRIQMSLLYFGFGVTPFVFSNLTQGTPNYFELYQASGAISGLTEVGFLWSITPKFSVAFTASGQWVKLTGASSFSPGPALDAGIAFRFYWGFSHDHGTNHSTEFKGWRYPFGREIN